MIHRTLRHILSTCLGGGAILATCAPVMTDELNRPSVVREIEDGYDGFYTLTTADGHNYEIYQRIESGQGIPPEANVVCMMNTCLLEVASMSESVVDHYSDKGSNLGGLRRRLADIRDAYSAMQNAPPDRRQSAIDEWHDSTARLTLCLSREECR